MTWETLFMMLEDRQRYMTANRHQFIESEIALNGMLILAVERLNSKPIRIRADGIQCMCPNPQCQFPLGDIDMRRKFVKLRPKHCEECGQKLDWSVLDNDV